MMLILLNELHIVEPYFLARLEHRYKSQGCSHPDVLISAPIVSQKKKGSLAVSLF